MLLHHIRKVALLAPALGLLPTAALAQFPNTFRSIDGSGNNFLNPAWGSAGIDLRRMATMGYADGVGLPTASGLPSARAVSNAVCAQTGSRPNRRGVSDMFWQWGQFIDHDMDLTSAASPTEPFPIQVPMGDPQFDPFATGVQTIALSRSACVFIGAPLARQQTNDITAFLDASMVYGSDAGRTLALRTLDGTGRLRTSAGDLLPFNTGGLPNAPSDFDPAMFLAGDVRANEQSGLTALHTLFVREHNVWADSLRALYPTATGDHVFEVARAIVGAEIQAITYRQWLPLLLGENAMPSYLAYDPSADPGILNEFSTAAFRLGHTMLSPTLRRLDENLATIPSGDLPLRNAFFDPSHVLAHGIDPLLRGLARQRAQEVDVEIVDDVRNFLFGPPGAGGFDLAALNIQRGRDHGICTYNRFRVDVGLAPRAGFHEVSSDPAVQQRLASAYATVDDVDLWVGALAEDHLPGAMVGEVLFHVVRKQFESLRNGDRFWYQRHLSPLLQQFVEQQTLATIIRRNTGIGSEIQDDVFLLLGSIADLGGGCGGGGSQSPLGPFALGNPAFTLRLDGAANNAPFAVVGFAIGDDPTWFGCGACEILIPEFASTSLPVAAGVASLDLYLPASSGLLGVEVESQFLVATPTSEPCLPGAGVSASNRLRLVVGD